MENKDMNLFDFVLYCCRGFVRLSKSIGLLVLQTLRLGLQYFWIVIPCLLLSFLAGWLWTKQSLTMFNGKATILYVDGMREVVHEGVIDFLTLPMSEKMEYGLTEDWLNALDRVDIYNVIDCNADSTPDYVDVDRNIGLSDTINVVMRDRIHLSVKLFGRKDFVSFENALTKFFNSQDYLIKSHEHYKLIQKDRLDYFTKEVARLDSFSTYDYFLRPRYLGVEKGNGIISERKQELYYKDLIFVLKHKNYLEKQVLSTPNIINFQTPFIAYSMPSLFKYLISIMCGGVLGLLLALLIKYWGVVVAYMKEK